MEDNEKYEYILDEICGKLGQLNVYTDTVKIQSLLNYIDGLKIKYLY